MKYRSLFIIGSLLLTACAPTPNQMGNGSTPLTTGGGMMDSIGLPQVGGNRGGMMQGSFLPAQDKDISTLPEAKPMGILEVKDGDTITLNPELVRAMVNGKAFAMYAYNGQFPGPTLKVKQGSTFTVNVRNNIDVPTTIHWHGIRLENKFDGVAGVTQKAIQPGDSFTYTVKVPDEGMFWYHPHVREDLQQDMGLYGLLHVLPQDATAYPPVDREEYVILDDILLEGSLPMPYGEKEADHALMGRFGNAFLVNGNPIFVGTDQDPPPHIRIKQNTVVRFHVLNASNTRTFKIAFQVPGQQDPMSLKLIGSDGGRYEEFSLQKDVVLSPAERVTFDALFAEAFPFASYTLEHREPPYVDLLNVEVAARKETSDNGQEFQELQENRDVIADIAAFRPFFDKPIDKTIHLSVESMMAGMMQGGMQHGGTSMEEESGMDSTGSPQIEWEDPMPQVNAMSTKHNTQWKLIDEASAAENMDIAYEFKKGDKVKIRLVNDEESDGSNHPMQHPIHFHGQRFLVLAVDGKKNENLVWKDTVLVEKGQTVDILLDVSNPGDWMFHCHIAEHLSNGMMGLFHVLE